MKNKTIRYVWNCQSCDACNMNSFVFDFEIPSHMASVWMCNSCGEYHRVDFVYSLSKATEMDIRRYK